MRGLWCLRLAGQDPVVRESQRLAVAILRCLVSTGCLALTACGASNGPGAGIAPSVISHDSPDSVPSNAATAVPSELPTWSARSEADRRRKHARNQGYRDRYELSPTQRRETEALVRRLRPRLQRLRDRGLFRRDRVRRVLRQTGSTPVLVSADAALVRFRSNSGGICVNRRIAPERVRVDGIGPTLDGGCVESSGGH